MSYPFPGEAVPLLLDWYRMNARDLPQRENTDPYLTGEWRTLWLTRNKFSYLYETSDMMERIARQAADKKKELC
ncbi:MAG: hypothetical protein MJ192_10785 [Clostridia bacterium]|nr:hypothetical protein [Clostridia bacterium]